MTDILSRCELPRFPRKTLFLLLFIFFFRQGSNTLHTFPNQRTKLCLIKQLHRSSLQKFRRTILILNFVLWTGIIKLFNSFWPTHSVFYIFSMKFVIRVALTCYYNTATDLFSFVNVILFANLSFILMLIYFV